MNVAAVIPATPATITGPDRPAVSFIDSWLAGKTESTADNYRGDLAQFGRWLGQPADTDTQLVDIAGRLLTSTSGTANGLAHQWRGEMLETAMSPSTINRRLSVLRSLVAHGAFLGLVDWTLGVKSVKATPYRDTRGPGLSVVRDVLAAIPDTPKGARDRAIVRLLFDRGLRRGEVVGLDVEHFDPERCRVFILPKGKKEREPVTISVQASEAVTAWLEVRGDTPGPLFTNFDRAGKAGRLTGRSVARVVARWGDTVGASGVRPHGLRHSAITAVLDRTNGDFRAAREFSRHSKVETVAIYDDARQDRGGALSNEIADLV